MDLFLTSCTAELLHTDPFIDARNQDVSEGGRARKGTEKSSRLWCACSRLSLGFATFVSASMTTTIMRTTAT